MKYGCRNDPDFMPAYEMMDTFDEMNLFSSFSSDSSNANCSYPLTTDMPSVSSSSSNNLSMVDEAVRNIMMNENVDYSTSIKNEMMMFVVNSLYEQISLLKDQITFLWTESLTKQHYWSTAR